MARKMRKFSAGGAQGKYDRRMADIKKDFEKDSKGKTGRALEVLTAKRAQRTADAEDDRAKRMGTDRTATRKAEYDAEKNLSRTRKFGADKPAAAAEPAKVAAPAAAATTEAPKAKPQSFGAAFKEARSRLGAGKTFTYNGKSFTTNIAGEGRKATTPKADTPKADTPKADTPKVNYRNINFGKPSTSGTAATAPNVTPKPKSPINAGRSPGVLSGASFGELGGYKGRGTVSVQAPQPRQTSSDNNATNNAARAAKLATLKKAAEAPGATAFEKGRYKSAVSSGMYAKGGKVKGKDEVMMDKKKKPMPMGGKQLMPMKKKPTKEPITGGADTVPLTSDRKEFLKEMAKRNATPGMAKGGKMATKFGAAMKKKSADTKGRAMMKFAKGGSIDGCAIKGKTKTSMVKMKNGGSC